MIRVLSQQARSFVAVLAFVFGLLDCAVQAQITISFTGDTLICAGDSSQIATQLADPNLTCNFALEMNDQQGDGWGNSFVEIRVNGVAQDSLTVDSGAFQSEALQFAHGDTVELWYTQTGPGSFFNSFALFDADSNQLVQIGPFANSGLVFSFIVDCGEPDPLMYNYSWSPTAGISDATAMNPSIAPVAPTTYVLVVSDSLGDTLGIDSFYINVVPSFTLAPTATPSGICLGDSVVVQAGVGGAGNYSYQWTGAAVDSATADSSWAHFSQSGQVPITIEVTSDSGCVKSDTIWVTVSGGLDSELLVSGDSILCNGASAQLQTELEPLGNPSCSYLIYLISNNGNGWQLGANVQIQVNGNVVYQSNFQGGWLQIDTLEFTSGDQIDVSYFPPFFGNDQNTYQIVATDGTILFMDGPGPQVGNTFSTIGSCANDFSDWSFAWTPTATVSDSSAAHPIVSPTSTTTYTVVASDTLCGFSDTAAYTVQVVPGFTFEIQPQDTSVCLAEAVPFDATPDTAGSFTYIWSGASFNNATSSNPTGTFSAPGQAVVYVEVASSWGCVKTDSTSVTVSGSAAPVVEILGGPAMCSGDTLSLQAETGPGQGDICVYELQLTDNFGAGWNGALVTVTIDGVATNYTLANNQTFASFNIDMINGAPYSLSFQQGGAGGPPGQAYAFFDADGNVLFSDGPGAQQGVAFTGTGDCGGNPTAVYSYEWFPNFSISDTTGETVGVWPTADTSYVVVATDTVGGCTASDTLLVEVVSYVPVQVTQITDTFCSGNVQTVNLSATEPGGVWSGAGVTDTANGSWVANTAGAGSHAIVYTLNDVGSCVSSDTTQIEVLQTPQGPTVAPALGCEGSELVLTSSAATGEIYWYTDFQQTNLVNVGDTFNVGIATSSGIYWLVASNGSCTSAVSGLNYTIDAAPQTSPISGNVQASAWTPTLYSVTNASGNDYQWGVEGGTVTVGQGTANTTITWGNEGQGSIYVVESTANGCVGDTVFLTVDIGPNAVAAIADEFDFIVYPSPVSESATIEIFGALEGGFNLKMTDLAGRLVLTKTNLSGPVHQLSVHDLPSGVYLLELSGTRTLRKRVVVAN